MISSTGHEDCGTERRCNCRGHRCGRSDLPDREPPEYRSQWLIRPACGGVAVGRESRSRRRGHVRLVESRQAGYRSVVHVLQRACRRVFARRPGPVRLRRATGQITFRWAGAATERGVVAYSISCPGTGRDARSDPHPSGRSGGCCPSPGAHFSKFGAARDRIGRRCVRVARGTPFDLPRSARQTGIRRH